MQLRILSFALDEIKEAALWYDSQKIGLGTEFWEAVDDRLGRIEAAPWRFGKSEFANSQVDYRYSIVPRFQYVIHFAVAADEIQILAVAHPARKPGYWLRRVGR